MPETDRARLRAPRYLRHRSGGRDRAFCYVYDEAGTRRRLYLGDYDSPASHRAFRDALDRVLDGATIAEPRTVERRSDGVTIEHVVARFLRWAERHYLKNGRPTGETSNYVYAVRPLLKLFRDEPADAFGPRKLRDVQELLVESGLARPEVNRRVRRVRRVIRWAVAEELVDPNVLQRLEAVDPLQAGRTEAREPQPVEPVPIEDFEATLPHLTPSVRTLLLVMLHTGMRPNEACQLRARDIDRSGPIWIFEPAHHKNEHLGKRRRVAIGPNAQRLLSDLVESADPKAPIFSPQRSEAERRLHRRQARRTPRTPSQRARDRQRADHPRRELGDAWTTSALRRAVHRACDQAEVPRWSPGQLRHNFQDLAERACGLEAASKALGHATLATTEHYRSKLDVSRAIEVARAIG